MENSPTKSNIMINKPNPGGDVSAADPKSGEAGNQSALQMFYSKLLASGPPNKK